MYKQKYLAIAEIAYLVTEYHSALIKYSIVQVFLSAKRNFMSKNAEKNAKKKVRTSSSSASLPSTQVAKLHLLLMKTE